MSIDHSLKIDNLITSINYFINSFYTFYLIENNYFINN